MTTKATFENTVDILVNAYLNDTLKHEDCTACAVGNIISYNGYKFDSDITSLQPTQWLRYIQKSHRGCRIDYFNPEQASEQVNASGYSSIELDAIERAFESGDYGCSKDDRMFNSLMKVIDVLAGIHGIDLTKKEEAKKLFVKA